MDLSKFTFKLHSDTIGSVRIVCSCDADKYIILFAMAENGDLDAKAYTSDGHNLGWYVCPCIDELFDVIDPLYGNGYAGLTPHEFIAKMLDL